MHGGCKCQHRIFKGHIRAQQNAAPVNTKLSTFYGNAFAYNPGIIACVCAGTNRYEARTFNDITIIYGMVSKINKQICASRKCVNVSPTASPTGGAAVESTQKASKAAISRKVFFMFRNSPFLSVKWGQFLE